jgi:arsenate reductase
MVLQKKKSILFVCTHNSSRSQLAEAILRHKYSDSYQVSSAGTEPTVVNPYILHILAENGIETSKLNSKNINTFLDKHFDLVVTVCDSAKESCPIFPNARNLIHKSFDDPNSFDGTDENIRKEVERVMREISDWIEEEFNPMDSRTTKESLKF